MNKINCVVCGTEAVQYRSTQITCGDRKCHRKRMNEKLKQKRIELKERGMCRNCYQPSVPGRISCQSCLDKNAKYRRDIQAEHPAYWMFNNSKRRASEVGVPFSLVMSDIEVPEYCPVLGIKLKNGIGVIHDSSPTLDRIIPELGYVHGNVVVMSRRANRLKNNAALDELIALGKWAESVIR